jgi:uncharacterized protein (TIGR04255 family)
MAIECKPMREAGLKLANPPIVEAVLDINCDLRPAFVLDEVKERAKEAFNPTYPQLQELLFQEHKLQLVQGADSGHSVRRGIAALRFSQSDGKQLVQVRNGGYSFNRLSPYTGLDDYLPEIERTWRMYVEIVQPAQVRG